mmetsp:Transcript_63933/g.183791  ORF Transcript_63933/g.183791 Transcript_63933/m.183791 type:complete len:324 (+) Transcript_63933:64-1035(+)
MRLCIASAMRSHALSGHGLSTDERAPGLGQRLSHIVLALLFALLRLLAVREARQHLRIACQVQQRAAIRGATERDNLVVPELVEEALEHGGRGGDHAVGGLGQQPALGDACAAAGLELVLGDDLDQLPVTACQALQHQRQARLPRLVLRSARVAPTGQAIGESRHILDLVGIEGVDLVTAEVEVLQHLRRPSHGRPNVVDRGDEVHSSCRGHGSQNGLVLRRQALQVVHNEAQRPHRVPRSAPCGDDRRGERLHGGAGPSDVRVQLLQDVAQALGERYPGVERAKAHNGCAPRPQNRVGKSLQQRVLGPDALHEHRKAQLQHL